MNDTLEHYGVIGMKWSRRRAIKKASKKAAKKARKTSIQTSAEWNKKYSYRSKMSDDALKSAVNRLRLENELGNQLSKQSQYTPKTTTQKVGIATMSVAKGFTGAVAGTNNFTKNVAGIGNNTIATYKNSNRIADLSKVNYRKV